MTKSDNQPHLRILVTPNCNLKCPYCRPGGEGYSGEKDILLTPEEIKKIVEICISIGFRDVKVSGGEPFLRKDLSEILKNLASFSELKTIQLITNGTLLSKFYHKIADIDFKGITISLDTINPKTYQDITGVNKLNDVLEGIEVVRMYGKHPITINCIVTKKNVCQIEDMIRFAEEIDATLKLIDFMKLEYPPELNWEEDFVDFSILSTYLEINLGLKYIGVEKPAGGLGTPMIVFQTENGIKVLLRDGQVGTNYHESCRLCKNYPCHDALISMRITHNGFIKRCLIRDDNLIDIRTPLRRGDLHEVEKLICESYSVLRDAKYYPHKWSPAVEQVHIKSIRWSYECYKIFTS